ncbi:MAG: hypothetical protein DLM54_10025 [Acidimicrobiales bacterium]|nr:MAG: hypothetical protein DLM54_10025 [Acidimicrobiales bacterium]
MIPNPTETPTLSVEQAGRLLGLGRSAAYALATRGELPGLIHLGRRRVVATARLLAVLGLDPGHDEGPASPAGPVASTSTPIGTTDSGDQHAVYQ